MLLLRHWIQSISANVALLNIILGAFSSLVFAPSFIFPAGFLISLLYYQIYNSISITDAAKKAFYFGFGHFLAGCYWITLGVSVYLEEFWWFMPFSLIVLPAILAIFISAASALSFVFRNNAYYHFIFVTNWIVFEKIRSVIFTGLPWNLIGYSISFSQILSQSFAIFSVYGTGFIILYIFTSPVHILRIFCSGKVFASANKYDFKISLFVSTFLLAFLWCYGFFNLLYNDTKFSEIKVRLVQPSIEQSAKWSPIEFIKHLNLYISLSNCSDTKNTNSEPKQENTDPDIILWPEAALTISYDNELVKSNIKNMLSHCNAASDDNAKKKNTILITGGILEKEKYDIIKVGLSEKSDIYNPSTQLTSSLYAIAEDSSLLFQYDKAHLVPFGEYIPFKNFLPIKKITYGIIDYTEGLRELVRLKTKQFDILIRPLICYESIFPSEVRIKDRYPDVIINATNDAWYGNSSGPYQHFYKSVARAIENGVAVIRVANNGISAIIDPNGRVISKLELNDIGTLDGYIPFRLKSKTLYSILGDASTLLAFSLTLLSLIFTRFLIKKCVKSL